MSDNNDGMGKHIPPLKPQDTEPAVQRNSTMTEKAAEMRQRTVGKLSSILKSGGGANKEDIEQAEENRRLSLLIPALPSDLVGGEVPYIGGREDETVWNAAAQACGTERVHYCYSISDRKCYYFAAPSSAMANFPDSWCPLAAALPGKSEFIDKETIYIYEQDGSAGAVRWDPETGRMQVFLGASRTIMPRIQSMDANFVTINPEAAKPVPWKNRALRQEALSRQLTKWLFFSGLIVTLLALFYWFISFTMANIFRPNLEEAKEITQTATFELMREASNAYQSNLSVHISRINELSMELNGVGGRLIKYEVQAGDKVEWLAVVPRAMEGDISRLGAQTVGIDEKERGYLRIKGAR